MMLENNKSASLESGKNLTYLTYIFYFLGVVSLGVFSTFGVIFAYIRRKGLQDTIFHSHLSYLIRTFWFFVSFSILGLMLTQVRGIGFIILILNHLWYIYRLVSGFTKLSDNKAI